MKIRGKTGIVNFTEELKFDTLWNLVLTTKLVLI
jgi:hypothetical protein